MAISNRLGVWAGLERARVGRQASRPGWVAEPTSSLRDRGPGQRPSHCELRRWFALAMTTFLLLGVPLTADAASVGLRQGGTGNTTVAALAGDSLSFELFLDTEGLSFEGYYIGVDFTGGPLTIQSVTHESLPDFFPIFGAPVIDNVAGTIRQINQSTFTTPLGPGEYVLGLITVELDASPGPSVTATPGLFGEFLGLGGGSCPSAMPSCSVTFSSAEIVPEPSTALLLATGLFGFALERRSKKRS